MSVKYECGGMRSVEEQGLHNEALEGPKGSGGGVPPASDQESGVGRPEALRGVRTFTQAEMDARLAALRTKMEQRHAMELGERDLRLAALKLGPELGIADVDVVLANVDRKSIVFEGGEAVNLGEVLEAAAQRLAAAVGAPGMPAGSSRKVSSGLAANPVGLEAGGSSGARRWDEFPRLGAPGLFRK